MAESSLSLLSLLGLGGVVGLLAGLYAAGKKFAAHLAELAASIEQVLRDPRHADLAALAQRARSVESDAKTLLGMLRQLFKG